MKCRSGYEVVIHTHNGKDKRYPLVGEINVSGEWRTHAWDSEGKSYATKYVTVDREHPFDIVVFE